MPNSDISGIGVRVSFYAQAILLGKYLARSEQSVTEQAYPSALLSTRSPEQAEITDALTTLVVTNLAYSGAYSELKYGPSQADLDSVTTLYLGFTSPSALTLYEHAQFFRYHVILLNDTQCSGSGVPTPLFLDRHILHTSPS
jgi:hypothetical protein